MTINCNYCHKDADSLDKTNPPCYSHSATFSFHTKCLNRIKNPEDAIREIEELTDNYIKWKKEHPEYKYQY